MSVYSQGFVHGVLFSMVSLLAIGLILKIKSHTSKTYIRKYPYNI